MCDAMDGKGGHSTAADRQLPQNKLVIFRADWMLLICAFTNMSEISSVPVKRENY
jgi:hypothetical protein